MSSLVIIHGWIRGNLGEMMMLSVFLEHIRPHFDSIHLKTCPGLEKGDSSFLVRSKLSSWEELPQYTRHITEKDVGKFDAVVFTPGAGIQLDNDRRSIEIMEDLDFCRTNQIPVAFPSHSVQPKFMEKLSDVFVVAREPQTYRGLQEPKHLSGDLAFLLDLPKYKKQDRSLICFRFDRFKSFQRKGNVIHCYSPREDYHFKFRLPENPVVTSSDYRRDKPKKIAQQLGLKWEIVDDLDSLIKLIGESKKMITDRYHPAIIAHRYGLKVNFIPRRINRDVGLLEYLNQDNGLKGKLEGISEVLDPNKESNPIQQATLDGINRLVQYLI